jgi:hypothetical protein
MHDWQDYNCAYGKYSMGDKVSILSLDFNGIFAVGEL